MQKNKLMRLSVFLAGVVFLFNACKPGQKVWTHDEEWANPEYRGTGEFHGTVVKKRGNTMLCKVCHGTSLQGTEEVQGCYECHFGPDGGRTPAGSAWQHGLLQHDNQSPEEPVCNSCHELYRNYGLKPTTCHDCHAIAPELHPLGQAWLDKKSNEFHGKSTLVCSSCHDLKSKCSTCHFDATGSKSPPASGWTHGTTPHNQLASSEAVCNQCHTLERSYGNGPATCHDCHGQQTGHVTGQAWLDPKSTQFHGDSTLTCSSCHDLNTKCASCHFGASGSKVPAGQSWTHGTTPHNQLASSEAVCNQCHTLERSYGNGPATCHDCHGTQNSHVLGQAWLDPKSAQFHGDSTLTCSSCHDLNTKCASCHFGASGSKVPAGQSWTHGTTPHNQLASSEAVCNQCHTLERSYGNGPATCHDCHGTQNSHVLGQAWLDPKSAQFHGDSTLTCSSCHDLNTKCASCHFGASGSKVPAGQSWTHGTTPHNQLASSEAVCNQCHTLERSYGNGPATCHDCHGSTAPHAVPFTAHGSSAKTNLIYCQQCHAQPADGGPGSNPRFNVAVGSLSSGCESSGCHKANTAHPVNWSGPDSTSHQSAQNMAAACALCHGADLSAGSGPACSNCHTAGSPLAQSNCESCHAKPPSGTTYPDLNGAHTIHNDLAGVSDSCTTCHAGAGSQTALHDNNVVNIAFTGYNAKSGTANYTAADQTCTNVSCHGGKKTPVWGTGTINVTAECTVCHASSGQYNSYVSGEHKKHVQDEKISCSECHDANKLAPVHFNDISSPAMIEAGQTIRDDLQYNGSACLFTCHLDNKRHTSGMTW